MRRLAECHHVWCVETVAPWPGTLPGPAESAAALLLFWEQLCFQKRLNSSFFSWLSKKFPLNIPSSPFFFKPNDLIFIRTVELRWGLTLSLTCVCFFVISPVVFFMKRYTTMVWGGSGGGGGGGRGGDALVQGGGFEAAQQTELRDNKNINTWNVTTINCQGGDGGLHIRNSCRDSWVRLIRLAGLVEWISSAQLAQRWAQSSELENKRPQLFDSCLPWRQCRAARSELSNSRGHQFQFGGPRPTTDLLTEQLTQQAVNLLWFLLLSVYFFHEAPQVLMFAHVVEYPTLDSSRGSNAHEHNKTQQSFKKQHH